MATIGNLNKSLCVFNGFKINRLIFVRFFCVSQSSNHEGVKFNFTSNDISGSHVGQRQDFLYHPLAKDHFIKTFHIKISRVVQITENQ